MKFKICVIGCGFMSSYVHGPSFQAYAANNPDTELSGCCDLDLERASNYRDKFGFKKAYTNYDEMFETEKPHAVCLISNVIHTKRLAIDILKKGYPVIMEKPPGLNEEECKEIIEVAKETGVPARVAFNRRYQPMIQELKAMIGNLEEPIYNIYYNMIRNHRFDEDFSTTTIHAIDTVRFLAASDYATIKIAYQHLPQYGEHVANIYLDGKLKSGAVVRLEFIVNGGAEIERCVINASETTFLLNTPLGIDAPGRIIHLKNTEVVSDSLGEENAPFFMTGGFYNENACFFDLLKANSEDISDVDSGLQSVIIADCIRKRIEEYTF